MRKRKIKEYLWFEVIKEEVIQELNKISQPKGTLTMQEFGIITFLIGPTKTEIERINISRFDNNRAVNGNSGQPHYLGWDTALLYNYPRLPFTSEVSRECYSLV